MKISLMPKEERSSSHLKHKSVAEHVSDLLQTFGVRPTRQRLDLSALLFDGVNKHVTAEDLLATARARKMSVSLATIYNSLNHFAKVGILNEFSLGAGKSYFDTNTKPHCHFFDEQSGRFWDIPPSAIHIAYLDTPPEGMVVDRIDVTVRLRKKDT